MNMARKTKTRIWRNYVAETLIWALIYTGCLFVFHQQASFVVAGASAENITTTDNIKAKAVPVQAGEIQHVPKENLAKFKDKFKSLIEENERIVGEYKSLLALTLDVEVKKEGTDRRFDWLVKKIVLLKKQHRDVKSNLDMTRNERNNLQKVLRRSKHLEKQNSDQTIFLREAVADLTIEKVKMRQDISKLRRRSLQFQKLLQESTSNCRTNNFSNSESNDYIWGSMFHQLSVFLFLIAVSHCFANLISIPYSKSKEIQTDPISEIVPLNLCNQSFNFSRLTSLVPSETVGTHIDTVTDSDRTQVHSKTIHTPFNQIDTDQKMTSTAGINSNEDSNQNQVKNKVIQTIDHCDSSSQTEYLDMMVISRENKVKIDKLPPTKYWKELRASQRQQWNICLVNVINNDTFVKDACIETEVTSAISCQTDDEMSMSYSIFDNYIQERFLHDLTFSPQKRLLHDDAGTEKLEDIEFWNADDVKSVWSSSSSSSRSSRSRCASQSSLTSGADSFEQMCGTPDKLSHKSFNDSAVELCDDISSLRSQTSSPEEAQPYSIQAEVMEVRRRPKQNRRRSSQDINNRDSAISMTFTDSESNISESLNDLTQGVNFDLGLVDSLLVSSKQAQLSRAHRHIHPDEEQLLSKKDFDGTSKHTFAGNKSNISEMELSTSSVTSTQYEKLGQMSTSSQCSVKSRDSGTQYECKEMIPNTNDCGIQCSGETGDPDLTEVGSQHEKYWLSQGTQYEMGDSLHDLPEVSIDGNVLISNSPRLSKSEMKKNRESSNEIIQNEAVVEEQPYVENAKHHLEASQVHSSPSPNSSESSNTVRCSTDLSSDDAMRQMACINQTDGTIPDDGNIVVEQPNAKNNSEGLSSSIIETSNDTMSKSQEHKDIVNEKGDVYNISDGTTADKLDNAFSRETLLRVLEESFPDVKHPGFFPHIVDYAMDVSPRFVAENMIQSETEAIERKEKYENVIEARTDEVEIPIMTETGVQTDKIPWLASQPLSMEYPRMSQIIRVVRPGVPSVFELARPRPFRPMTYRRY